VRISTVTVILGLWNTQLSLFYLVQDLRRVLGDLFGVTHVMRIGANHLSRFVAGLAFVRVRNFFLTRITQALSFLRLGSELFL